MTTADTPPPTSTQPLAGLKVLDLSRILAGPVCCQVLADLGADVVKVERPGAGDDTRGWGPPFVDDNGPSAYYLSANRGKRSLALDLAHDQGRPVLDALIRRADVLVENFLPDSLAKLGLEPARLAQLNPRLVACSISGFGRTGPLADTRGYDLAIQAASGIMSITGEPDGRPMKVGVAISDVITGLYAAISVLAGLHARSQGADPTAYDLALADCTLASLVNVAQSALVTGAKPRRYGNAHPNIVPYESFATADGHLVLGVGNDGQWKRFCEVAGREDWAADARFSTNAGRVEHRDELIAQVEQVLRSRTTKDWLDALDAAGIPSGPVRTLDEILDSPQVAARQMVSRATDSTGRVLPLLATPIRATGEPPVPPTAPPSLGEHSDVVLSEWLGFDAAQIAALRASGAVA